MSQCWVSHVGEPSPWPSCLTSSMSCSSVDGNGKGPASQRGWDGWDGLCAGLLELQRLCYLHEVFLVLFPKRLLAGSRKHGQVRGHPLHLAVIGTQSVSAEWRENVIPLELFLGYLAPPRQGVQERPRRPFLGSRCRSTRPWEHLSTGANRLLSLCPRENPPLEHPNMFLQGHLLQEAICHAPIHSAAIC